MGAEAIPDELGLQQNHRRMRCLNPPNLRKLPLRLSEALACNGHGFPVQ